MRHHCLSCNPTTHHLQHQQQQLLPLLLLAGQAAQLGDPHQQHQ
jgi:hypothetical protein